MVIMGGAGPISKIDLLKYSSRSKSLDKARTGEYDRKKGKIKWHKRMLKGITRYK